MFDAYFKNELFKDITTFAEKVEGKIDNTNLEVIEDISDNILSSVFNSNN